MQKNVLFICRHNSGRSQMVEAMLNRLGKGWFRAESAGLEPKSVDSMVVTWMKSVMACPGNDPRMCSFFINVVGSLS